MSVEEVLRARGFSSTSKGVWNGQIVEGVLATISIPEAFPDQLPVVRVDRSQLPRKIPHVEADGTLCLVDKTGLLWDVGRPAELVGEVLDRARLLITQGLDGANDHHFLSEFVAYWRTSSSPSVASLLSLDSRARTIAVGAVVRRAHSFDKWRIVADNRARLGEWASRVGVSFESVANGLYLPLERALDLPDFDDVLSIATFARDVAARVGAAGRTALQAWLKASSLPSTWVLSFPGAAGEIAVAADLSGPRDVPGFRRGRCPSQIAIGRDPRACVIRCDLQQIDARTLLARVGDDGLLIRKRVAIVGCGSVGSFAAFQLAAAGVGELRLVDPDLVQAGNVYRHLVGSACIGQKKVSAVARLLVEHFPEIRVEFRAQDVDVVLEKETEWLAEADLVLLATGDPTLELRLNKMLLSVARMSVWIEAYGIGGHALLMIPGGAGCFECLFVDSNVHGLVNQAAFAAPGQTFVKTLTGCSGAFTPFGAAAAQRAALEAARVAREYFEGMATTPRLISWRESPSAFLAAGHTLSSRARVVAEGARVTFVDHSNSLCRVCST